MAIKSLERTYLILIVGLVFGAMRLAPAPVGLSAEGWAVAALAVTMAVLWLSGALPLALTSVLPFILLPLSGVMTPAQVAGLYWSPVIFLVLGGAIVAVAVETHQLHRRLALAVVARAPASPRGLVLAFMAATAICSMGVSNTATTLIMMPVALAVAGALAGPTAAARAGLVTAMVLGVAYGANIGGLGTLVGTPTNAIAAGIVERSLGLKVDFLTWLAFGVPLVVLAVPAVALILIWLFRVPSVALDRAELAQLLGRQGPLTADQKRLLPLLALLLLGWVAWPLLAKPLNLPAPDDGIVAMTVGLLLFVVPASGGGTLLDWKSTKARLPWDILLLFGGGLALAGAITESGLATWIGAQLSALKGVNPIMLALLVVTLVVLVTEFASNVASASAFMPVVAAVAIETGAAPLPLVMGAAMAATWSFMIPSGTAPNAVAYATGKVTIVQMVRAGLMVNVIGVFLIVGVSFGVAALLG